MTKFTDKLAAIQMDHVGNMIDIISKDDAHLFESPDYIVTTIEKAVEYKKFHPNKGFFVYDDSEIEAFLKENDAL